MSYDDDYEKPVNEVYVTNMTTEQDIERIIDQLIESYDGISTFHHNNLYSLIDRISGGLYGFLMVIIIILLGVNLYFTIKG